MHPNEVGHLEQAREHVARSEALVAAQRGRIADLERDGHPVADAKGLLETLEQTLSVMREHLATEERLARRDAD